MIENIEYLDDAIKKGLVKIIENEVFMLRQKLGSSYGINITTSIHIRNGLKKFLSKVSKNSKFDFLKKFGVEHSAIEIKHKRVPIQFTQLAHLAVNANLNLN